MSTAMSPRAFLISKTPQAFRLLELPLELRREIFGHVLRADRGRPILIFHKKYKYYNPYMRYDAGLLLTRHATPPAVLMPLLLISKRVSEEVWDAFWWYNAPAFMPCTGTGAMERFTTYFFLGRRVHPLHAFETLTKRIQHLEMTLDLCEQRLGEFHLEPVLKLHYVFSKAVMPRLNSLTLNIMIWNSSFAPGSTGPSSDPRLISLIHAFESKTVNNLMVRVKDITPGPYLYSAKWNRAEGLFQEVARALMGHEASGWEVIRMDEPRRMRMALRDGGFVMRAVLEEL